MKDRILILGLFCLSVGAVFLLLENSLFQYVDEEGFLHESFFLPLGVFTFIIGFLLLMVYIVRRLRTVK